jgi:menaquinone-dependent protoporphyrinogen oxidase
MRVLVTAASKHGATTEIAGAVATALRERGLTVDLTPPSQVTAVEPYDAVVLGSGVYAGRWVEEARTFVDRHAESLATRPVWLFSSGPLGDPPKPAEDAVDAAPIGERLGARGHRTFAGRLDRSELGFMERTITNVVRAPDGDFRDWEAIRAWAGEIAAELAAPLR